MEYIDWLFDHYYMNSLAGTSVITESLLSHILTLFARVLEFFQTIYIWVPANIAGCIFYPA